MVCDHHAVSVTILKSPPSWLPSVPLPSLLFFLHCLGPHLHVSCPPSNHKPLSLRHFLSPCSASMHPCTHVHVHRIHLGSEVCLLLILSPDLLFSALTILECLEVLFQLWRKQRKGHSLNRNNFHTKSKSPKQASPLVLWIMLAHISFPVGVTQHWKSWVHDMKSMAMTMTTRRGQLRTCS